MKRILILLVLFFAALAIAWAAHDPRTTCQPREGFAQSLSTISSITAAAVGGALFVSGNWIWSLPFLIAPAVIEMATRLYQGCSFHGSLGTAAQFGLTMGLLFVPVGASFVAITYPYVRYVVIARLLGSAVLASSVVIGAWWLGGR